MITTQRTFIALNLPTKIKTEINSLIAALKQNYRGWPIKWVTADNLHLTLHFLGEITEEQIKTVSQSLASIAGQTPALNLQLSQLGAFANWSAARVIWLSLIETQGDNLKKLQAAIGQSLLAQGLAVDSRPWQAHITLARLKTPVTLPPPTIKIKLTNFNVSTVELMASQLLPTGPIYSVLASHDLKL